MARLIENTVTGELQEVEVFDPASLGPNEIDRGVIPAGIPGCAARWNGSAIVTDLAGPKAQALARVRALREQHETGGLTTPFGPIETDAESQRKISGAVVMAMLGGAAFSIDWRMANNAIVTLNATDMSNLGVLVGQHVSACQYRKNDLDAAIGAAATLAEIEAIDAEAGWPGS